MNERIRLIEEALAACLDQGEDLIQVKELQVALSDLDPALINVKFKTICEDLDPDNRGWISKTDFLRSWEKPYKRNISTAPSKRKTKPATSAASVASPYLQTPQTARSLSSHSSKSGELRLTEAKMKRKQAEYDARLLRNRILLLEQEEKRALKKIEQTKIKAKKVLDQQVVQQEKAERKQFIEEEIEHEHIVARMKSITIKESKARRKLQAKKSMVLKRQKEVQSVRLERIQLKREKEEILRASVHRAKACKEMVKQHEEMLRKKKEKEMRKHHYKVQERYQKKVAEESKRMAMKEQEVEEMKRKEMELIERLQNAQAMQEKSCNALVKAFERVNENRIALTAEPKSSRRLK